MTTNQPSPPEVSGDSMQSRQRLIELLALAAPYPDKNLLFNLAEAIGVDQAEAEGLFDDPRLRWYPEWQKVAEFVAQFNAERERRFLELEDRWDRKEICINTPESAEFELLLNMQLNHESGHAYKEMHLPTARIEAARDVGVLREQALEMLKDASEEVRRKVAVALVTWVEAQNDRANPSVSHYAKDSDRAETRLLAGLFSPYADDDQKRKDLNVLVRLLTEVFEEEKTPRGFHLYKWFLKFYNRAPKALKELLGFQIDQ